ncbi:MAG: hypothetical protein EVA58_04205 [Kiritimatiellaceae bacterium]|nr:MAG: hypothetical protein EVA58_04205 [Kiritimatiellaceae bacterium]
MKTRLLLISGWAHGTHTLQPMADRLAPLFDIQLLTGADALNHPTLPETDAILTGSMGGLLALQRPPSSCQKIMLLSGTACFCKRPNYHHGTPERILQRMRHQLDKDPHTLLDTFHQNVHAPQKPSRQKKDAPHPDLSALHAGLEYLQHTDLRPQIPSFPLPVLILHGTHDHIIPLQAAQWLHEQLPTSELIPFNGLGHALPAHAFERVMQAAEHFLV